MTLWQSLALAVGILILVVGASCGLAEGLPGVGSSIPPEEAKQRVLALQDRGASFGPFGCTTYNLATGEEEPCAEVKRLWQRIADAEHVQWEKCEFGQHGLGGYLSLVSVSLNESEWHTIWVFDHDVC